MNYLQRGYGLDENGFIVRDVDFEKITPDYLKCVQEIIESLHIQLPKLLHSVYVYGSVARGDAKKGRSDLDILVIFNRSLSFNEHQRMKKVGESLSQKYFSLVRDIGIAQTTLDYCLDPINYYEQAFLRELCVCVDGEDLRGRFGPYKLTPEIAVCFNGDIAEVSERYLKKLQVASQDEFHTIIQSLIRKLTRTYYSMVMARSQIWSTKLDEQAAIFLKHFSEKKKVVTNLQEWMEKAPTDRNRAIAILEKESKWIVSHFAKEAQKCDGT